jgi:hypothetical protein
VKAHDEQQHLRTQTRVLTSYTTHVAFSNSSSSAQVSTQTLHKQYSQSYGSLIRESLTVVCARAAVFFPKNCCWHILSIKKLSNKPRTSMHNTSSLLQLHNCDQARVCIEIVSVSCDLCACMLQYRQCSCSSIPS